MDWNIREQFDIGGTAVSSSKYMGPKPQYDVDDPSEPNYGSGLETDKDGNEVNPLGQINETNIQRLIVYGK